MRKLKRQAVVVGLAAGSTIALTLGIVLPLTIHDSYKTVNKYIEFNGLKPTTDYSVGENIKLSLNVDPNLNFTGYEFQWYIQHQNENSPRLFETTTAPFVQLKDASAAWDGDTVYCLIAPSENSNGQNNSGSYFNSDLVHQTRRVIEKVEKEYWTKTVLHLTNAFQINGVSVNVQTGDNVVLDSKNNVVLTTTNTPVTLTATPKVSADYAQYVVYQWYLNGKPVEDATQSSYTIQNPQAGDSIYCEAHSAVAGNQQESNTVQSAAYRFNVVSSLALTANPIIVTAGDQTNPETIPAGNKVNLTAGFKLGGQELNSNSNEYTVSYYWSKNKVQLGNSNSVSYSLTNVTNNDIGLYTCTVTVNFNKGGSISLTSQPAHITVVTPGQISVSPVVDQAVYNGQTATFNVKASLNQETTNLAYQWEVQMPNETNWSSLGGQVNSALTLNPEECVKYNNAKFRCQVSCTNNFEEAKPQVSNAATLTVENPTFTTSLTANPTGSVNYGSNVTLTAKATFKSTISGNNYNPTFSYQWFQIPSGASKPSQYTKLDNQTKNTLTLNNLGTKENGASYVCFVYPQNAYVSNDAEWTKIGEFTDKYTVALNSFGLSATATVTNNAETSATAQNSITNNLGQKFTLTANPSLASGYDNKLPSGYEYSYQWQTANSNADNATWSNIGNPSNSATLSEQVSELAGLHYYRCQVSIVPAISTLSTSDNTQSTSEASSALATFTTTPVSVNTYPTLTIIPPNHNYNFVVPNNGYDVSLTPFVKVVLCSNPALLPEGQPGLPPHGLENCVSHYNPTYQWKINDTVLTADNASKYPFIKGSVTSDSLNFNVFNHKYDIQGAYSLTVAINNTPYTIQQPINVTESEPTFSVSLTASGKVGSDQIELVAKVNPIVNDNKQKNKAKDVSPDNFVYNFCYLDPDSDQWSTFPDEPTTTPNSPKLLFNTSNNTPLTKQDQGKFKFAVLVTNMDTLETEMTTVPVGLNVICPTIESCTVRCNTTSIQPNVPVILTASASPSFPVADTNMSYQWQYKTSSGDWTNLNPQSGINISSITASQSSQLEINSFPLKDSGTQFRCLASYGDYATNFASDPVTITVNQGVIAPTTDQIDNLISTLRAAFTPQELNQTLSGGLGMSKNGQDNPQWSTSAFTQICKSIGMTSQQEWEPAFGKKPVTKISPIINVAPNTDTSSGSPEGTSTANIQLLVELDLQPGYTWSSSNIGYDISSEFYMTSTKLYLKIQTSLPPAFTLQPNSCSQNIELSSSNNKISIQVKSNKPISSLDWYAIKPDHDALAKYVGFQITPDSAEFKSVFGQSATVQFANNSSNDNVYGLNISNIDVSNSNLDGYFIVPFGTISKDGEYFQESYGTNNFTINVTKTPAEEPGQQVPPVAPVPPTNGQTGQSGNDQSTGGSSGGGSSGGTPGQSEQGSKPQAGESNNQDSNNKEDQAETSQPQASAPSDSETPKN